MLAGDPHFALSRERGLGWRLMMGRLSGDSPGWRQFAQLLLQLVPLPLQLAELVLEIACRRCGRNRLDLAGLARPKGANVRDQVLSILLADPLAERRHERSLAIEDAQGECGSILRILPSAHSEIRDRRHV